MGWNSYDCFGLSVTESQVQAAADYMAANLKSFGYQYVVVDIRWYDPDVATYSSTYWCAPNARVAMDQYGRLQPATNRFPSAGNGLGFKPLADYVHSKGLKFGIHLMRGIPRAAYNQNTAVFGTSYHAQDIADTASACRWDDDMYGVDVTRPGGQEYYDSVADQWAAWGVDFVKIDDLTSDPALTPRPYHVGEVEAIRKAIDQTGRQIVFSTSPGATPLGQGRHVMTQSNMWRIDDDFWDDWSLLFKQFQQLRDWTPFRRPGHFPDADMLPLGKIGAGNSDPNAGRSTRFTADEQQTLMTLWCIARSPLMYGGDLTRMDAATLALITNAAVLAVNQNSAGNRELFNQNGLVAWVADVPNSNDKYLAMFNTNDPVAGQTGSTVSVSLGTIGLTGKCQVQDLWQHTTTTAEGNVSRLINWHGAGLYRISGAHLPKPPSTVAAYRGDGQIKLLWDPSSGATSYTIYRSNTSGGPYVAIATGITTTNYLDDALENDTPYYYVIAASTDVGTSAASAEVSEIPIGEPAPAWETLDIGYPGFAGAGGQDGDFHILHGVVLNVWATTESFRFYWQRMAGDMTAIARVGPIGYTADWAKAGVMFREDGTPGARFSFMFVTPGGQASLQYRATPNNNAGAVSATPNSNPERWVKLVRKGNTFFGYHSVDGASWVSAGQVNITMASSAYVGLGLTAHNNNALSTATFDFVALMRNSPAQPNNFRVLQCLRSGSDALIVTFSQTGKTYQLQKATAPGAAWQNVGSAQSGTGDLLTFPDPGGAGGQQAFYRVTQSP